MKLPDAVPAGFEVLGSAEVFVHGHLPLAAAFCRRLGLVELVNRLVPSQMAVSPGLVVQAMVLNTLSGRTPLYHLENFLSELDLELLLGEPVDAHAFNPHSSPLRGDFPWNYWCAKTFGVGERRTVQSERQ